ncbi:TPA: hypothetical protein DCZ46_03030 [Candidatus Campbellbacteria bacterium]|nr:MAG: alpha/beta-Hydrolase [Candidatus Campbellbacteria bacterium GW2011_OD1_34_28]KKP74898.1 MAG: hypothetical protein UR74_C0002G0164 [Candidatus Campbellbacteria bacterium GW2011_GWD2_35_24]KKP75784.1 MAG: hypothetical protein UR75_C0002G0165 [Candidatus Campbellbacteria bacterium GW2011_GWC2_35_28]KKP76968.1 MAG: hypothetical protein UR76_C0002G0169 [Candidatus Campbellbacteria bacterium GW2011_GWC1_35_31]KKP78894.1 MAG: hypothetical protein UR79_C0002G0169 [Candidatus Campbellbacteria ba
MEKKIYIIPGFEETTKRRPYQLLRKIAKDKGYEVVFKNIDWNKKLSQQIFSVSDNDIIFGFSLGAVLAWLVAQEYKCEHIILASMTPHYSWKDKKIKKALVDLLGAKFVNDVVKKLDPKHKAKKQTIIYGDLEEEDGDILVKDTQHELTANYLKEIKKII